jgi:drug/metabolite transporter (DMT)-like permease
MWDVWIPVTIAAAGFQIARTALQHRLRALLTVSGAGFVRYLYGAPLSLLAVTACLVAGLELPSIDLRFWPTIAAAGVAQIVGTVFLIRAFDARDFAIGTVLSKTEVVQVALFSLVLLGEPLRAGGWIGAVVCTIGVVLMSTRGRRLRWTSLRDPASLYGLAAGAMLGLAAIGIRAATGAIDDGTPAVFRALLGLAVMNGIQAVIHGSYIAARRGERGQIRLALSHWRSSAIVGALSVSGSACWAVALALENAAKVRTLGQVELLFAFGVSTWWLKDRHTRAEYVASALVVGGVLAVMLTG